MIDMDSLPPIENIEGSIWHWRDEGPQKKLLIDNRAPQCHECANNLYQWLNGNIGEKIQVKILNIGPPNPLWRREIREQIYRQLGAKVTPLFSLINKQQQWEALLETEYFPVILLQHPPDSMAMVIAYEDLFSTNPLDRMLPASTQQRLLRFSQE